MQNLNNRSSMVSRDSRDNDAQWTHRDAISPLNLQPKGRNNSLHTCTGRDLTFCSEPQKQEFLLAMEQTHSPPAPRQGNLLPLTPEGPHPWALPLLQFHPLRVILSTNVFIYLQHISEIQFLCVQSRVTDSQSAA